MTSLSPKSSAAPSLKEQQKQIVSSLERRRSEEFDTLTKAYRSEVRQVSLIRDRVRMQTIARSILCAYEFGSMQTFTGLANEESRNKVVADASQRMQEAAAKRGLNQDDGTCCM